MKSGFRDRARDLFHRALYHRRLGPCRRRVLGWTRRAQAHLLNCSTDARANGEEWLIDQLPDRGVFLDVGFNRGKWTQRALAAHPEAFVHAFDPCRDVGELAEGLGLDPEHFAFHGIALSNEIGTAIFHDYGEMNESNSLVERAEDISSEVPPETYEVDVLTLDAWTRSAEVPFIDVLKIDAEGFDLHVLEGSRELLEARRVGLIVFEYASGWFASKRTLAEAHRLLSEVGYEMYRLFPFFIAPYRYQPRHEGMLVGYYVALSPEVDASAIPRREMEL